MNHAHAHKQLISWSLCVAIVTLSASGCVSFFSDDSAFVEGDSTTDDLTSDGAQTDTLTQTDGATGTSPDVDDDTSQICEPTAGGVELCDGIDNDCDQAIDEGCDDDGDQFCDSSVEVSSPPPAICLNGGNDCDDLRPEVNPDAAPRCVAFDLNCSGAINPPNLADIDVIRDPNSSAISVDITQNNNNLATVWVEATPDTQRVRFGTIAGSGSSRGQFISTPTDVSPIEHAAHDAALAWDAPSSTYGVAWVAVAPDSDQPSVFFAQLDPTGALVSGPIRIDSAIKDTVRVLHAREPSTSPGTENPGYFVVLYNQTAGDQNDIYAASLPILPSQPLAFAPPQRVISERRLADASIAWHPGNDSNANDSAIYLLWPDYSVSPERLSLKAIKASNATSALSTRDFAYPAFTTGTQSRAILHNVNDTLLISWGRRDTSGTLALNRIVMSEIDTWGGFTGPVHNLVSGVTVSLYEPRALLTTPDDRALLFYKGSDIFRRQHFNLSDWRANGTTQDTDIDSLYYEKSVDLQLFLMPDNNYFAFDRYADNGFFEIFGFYEFSTTANVSTPASKAPRSTPVTHVFYQAYDPAQDAIELIQLNALDSAKIERVFIQPDGSLSPPVNITTRPDPCYEGSQSYINGFIICAESTSDYTLCTSTTILHVFDETAKQWSAHTLNLPNSPDPTNGCELFNPLIFYPEQSGDITVIGSIRDTATDTQAIKLLTFDAQGAITTQHNLANLARYLSSPFNIQRQTTDKSTAISFDIRGRFGDREGAFLTILNTEGEPIFSQAFFSGSQDLGFSPQYLDAIVSHKGAWWLSGSRVDSAAQAAEAFILSVDEDTGTPSDPIILSSRFFGTGSVQFAFTDDVTLSALYRTQTNPSYPYNFSWSLVTVNTETSTISTPTEIYATSNDRRALSLVASADYIAVAIPDLTNPTIKSFNALNEPIGEGSLGRSLPDAYTSLLIHNGDALRWLLRADGNNYEGRLLHITATCD